MPIDEEEVSVAHFIRDHREGVSFFNLLDNFKIRIDLALVYLLSIFGILATSFLINELTHRIYRKGTAVRRTSKFSRRIVSALSSFGKKRLSAIGLFFVSVHLFIWITQLFLTNNIKVEV